MRISNSIVSNAIAANRRKAKNSIEVEISPGYAARAQYAMKDAARGVSGVRISGTNTLSCPNDDAADDVIEIIKMAGIPASEVWTNSRRVARNAGGAYDFAAQAGKRFKEAYEALAGCAYYLDRLSTLGAPDDVRGNDAKIASWAKDKQRKVRSIMAELDQGRL